MGWVIDLDGVVWLGDQSIPGAAEAVRRLRARGEPVVFVTNNSSAPVTAVEARLAEHGISATGDVVTSALAAATLVRRGETVLVCGGEGLMQAVAERGARVVAEGDADAVVVGLHESFDYQRLDVAATAVRRGARLLASNDDATIPSPGGPRPGAGALLAAVATAAGAVAQVAGKPHPPMADVVRGRIGAEGTMVGDRPETDGLFARRLGYRFALVLTGVTPSADGEVEPRPDLVAPSLADLVD